VAATPQPRLQKLSCRRRAELSERFGLLSCGWPPIETFEISQEDQKDRRSEGGKNAFFNSEDRIEKYSSKVQKQKTSLQAAGGSANPSARPSALLIFL
jgi:hypothetical protein